MSAGFISNLAEVAARPLHRLYDRRHPSSLERHVISLFGFFLRYGTPSDKWSLHLFVKQWFSATEMPPADASVAPKRILLFTTYRIQITHDLALAALLAWRGHSVTIAYLPKLQSPIKGDLTDAPSAARYLKSTLAMVEQASGGRVRCLDLRAYLDETCTVDQELVRRQAISDLVIRVKRENYDPSDPETKADIDTYEKIGRVAQQTGRGFLAQHAKEFDLCLIANGSTFEPAHWFATAREFGLTVNTYEKFSFRNVRVLNHNGDFRSLKDLDTIWSRREAAGYLDSDYSTFASGKAMDLLAQRRNSSTQQWAWALQGKPGQSTADSLAAAGIDEGHPFVLVCTNVPFDVGWDQLVRVFPSMREWLVATVRHLLEETDLHVVVRAHPGEAENYGGLERSEHNLAAAGLLDHPRLTMISADEDTNTYGLMEKCLFGAVFSSTAGLEMAMMGRRVAVGSDVYYGHRGYTHDPADADDYLRILSDLAANPGDLSPPQQRDAQLFHFILHFVAQWPYPYDKPSGVRDMPPHKLVQSSRINRYLPTLDALTLSDAEWQERAGEFFTPGNAHVPTPKRSMNAE